MTLAAPKVVSATTEAAGVSPAPATSAHVPGVPPAVQTNMWPFCAMTKSPVANVPEPGAPEAVAPTYRDAAVAPVRPVETLMTAVKLPPTEDAPAPVRLMVPLPVTAELATMPPVKVFAADHELVAVSR